MRCLLDGNNARILAKAVQSLSKFGAYLFVEADDDGLLLRTLNATQSSIGSFKFKRVFFIRFLIEPNVVNYCKITAKSCFNVFRNMKQVEHCEIKICGEELRFEIKCQYEQTKKVSISIIDEENITAAVNVENAPNTISASCKIFNEISSNFNSLEEEITLEAHPNTLIAKNYIEGARVNDKFMRSQLKFSSSELDKYDIKEQTCVTFCLKEFRAFLAFAEALNEHVTIQFSDAGNPLFLRIKKCDSLEGVLITSTLCPDDIEYYEDANQSAMNRSSLNGSIAQKRKIPPNTNSNSSYEPQTKRQNFANETTLSNETVLFNFDDGNFEDSNFDQPEVAVCVNTSEENPRLKEQTSNDGIVEAAQISNSMSVQFYDTEEQNDVDMEEVITQSPRIKKLRTIFSRCFQNTYFPEEPTSSSEVFAPDSDPDD